MKRDSQKGAGKVPGPGAYSYRELVGNEMPKFTLTGKPKDNTSKGSIPGPNAYGEIQGIQSRSAAYGYCNK